MQKHRITEFNLKTDILSLEWPVLAENAHFRSAAYVVPTRASAWPDLDTYTRVSSAIRLGPVPVCVRKRNCRFAIWLPAE